MDPNSNVNYWQKKWLLQIAFWPAKKEFKIIGIDYKNTLICVDR